MHLRNYRVVRQIDHSHPEPAQKFKPVVFFLWLGKQLGLAEEVVVCYEAGCFGYQPARRMQKMGVKVYVIAPQNWDEQGKGQVNDKHDAQVICRRLSEYLAGHHKALSIVRIPSPQEEERRARGRLREQLQRELRRIQAIGRSLLLQWEMPVRGRWWAELSWPGMVKAVPEVGHRPAGELEEDDRGDRGAVRQNRSGVASGGPAQADLWGGRAHPRAVGARVD